MNYIRFDRHANMSMETLDEVHSLINASMLGKADFSLLNMMFGLFDGYLYDGLLIDGKKQLTQAVYNRLEAVVNEIKNYPDIIVYENN